MSKKREPRYDVEQEQKKRRERMGSWSDPAQIAKSVARKLEIENLRAMLKQERDLRERAEAALKGARDRLAEVVHEKETMARHVQAQSVAIDKYATLIRKLERDVKELEDGNFKEVRVDMEAQGSWS